MDLRFDFFKQKNPWNGKNLRIKSMNINQILTYLPVDGLNEMTSWTIISFWMKCHQTFTKTEEKLA